MQININLLIFDKFILIFKPYNAIINVTNRSEAEVYDQAFRPTYSVGFSNYKPIRRQAA